MKKEDANNRKKFRKEMKEYEKMLMKKAKLGILSLSEKEEYQRICRNKYRNSLFSQEKQEKIIIVIVIGSIVLGTGYFIHTKGIGDKKVVGAMNKLGGSSILRQQNNQLIEEMNQITDALNNQSILVSEAVEEYSANGTLSKQYLIRLKEIIVTTEKEELAALLEIYNEYTNIEEVIFTYLETTTKAEEKYVNTLLEKLHDLIEQYNLEMQDIS